MPGDRSFLTEEKKTTIQTFVKRRDKRDDSCLTTFGIEKRGAVERSSLVGELFLEPAIVVSYSSNTKVLGLLPWVSLELSLSVCSTVTPRISGVP